MPGSYERFFADDVGGALNKLVLLAVATHSGPDGKCWLTSEEIAQLCEISPQAVWRCLGDLASRGFLLHDSCGPCLVLNPDFAG